ncbi:hypothetical protein C5C74_09575 [Rathayibacter sp. AY1E8]|uniref:hypothetical protein n=1 Tax=unclassified Rathayibacter TaxID=2609250 RepID=UPI000CE77880|nr:MULTISPECIES: hypothetical protein [unclassified Rathayibacter]PPG17980.1 hypothetical protein C5C74_09575 [Rathayibacter sp. AY1E8]PPI01178.1 hypothetical protein C5C95_03310 [Rathayibacter sp. AY1B7]
MTERQKRKAVTTYLTADAGYDAAVATFLAAADSYTAALASVDVAKAIAPTLDCEKVTVIAQMLEKSGHSEMAGAWIAWHSFRGDIDDDDIHFDDWREEQRWF